MKPATSNQLRKYIDVASFKTETDFDFLYINGKYMDGIKDSAELLGPPQGLIKWAPDSLPHAI